MAARTVIRLTTAELVVEVSPDRGGKITSLVHRASGREWLEEADAPLVGPPDASVGFDEGDLCGWDEMMPTIDPCEVDGEVAPDHGELWRHPWEVVEVDGSVATLSARAPHWGLALTRTLRLERKSLRVDYHVVNAGPVDRPVLGAAHPLLRHRRGTRLSLEGDLVALSDDGGVTELGPWPGPVATVDDLAEGQCAKCFVRMHGSTPSATLLDRDGTWLSFTWAATDAPFLGVWLDQSAYARHGVVALEPTNGAHDSLAVALRASGLPTPWVLGRGGERRWTVVAEVGRSASVPTRSRGPVLEGGSVKRGEHNEGPGG